MHISAQNLRSDAASGTLRERCTVSTAALRCLVLNQTALSWKNPTQL